MSIKKVFIVVLVIALFSLITIFIFWFKPSDHHAQPSRSVLVQTTAVLSSTNQIQPPSQDIEVKTIPTAGEQNMLKSIDARTAAAHLPSQIMQDDDNRTYIEYNPHVIESKSIGDHINIDIPKTRHAYDGKITHIERVNSDIVRWQGVFNGVDGPTSNFTITQSIKDQYATSILNTPEGSFIMESKSGYGWIVSDPAATPK